MKKIEEQRLPFSDYPSKEQEKDAMKARRLKVIRHAYLMRVDGEWAHFIVGTQGKDDIDFYGDMTLEKVYRKLSKTRPDYTPKVIINKGLEDYLRDNKPKAKIRQLNIFER